MMKLGILTSHPIQYQAPWFRALAERCHLTVYFAHQPNAEEQGKGFGQAFAWDVDLLSGYQYEFMPNVAVWPDTSRFKGCDIPAIQQRIAEEGFDAFIVMGWYLKCFWQAIRACRRLKIPVLVRGDSQLATPRSKLKTLAKELVYRVLLRQFDGFLTVGQRSREYLQHYGVPEWKLFPAPHFVDNAWFAERKEVASGQRQELRQVWGVRPGQVAVLFVGKFIPEKGLSLLVHGLAEFEKKQPGVLKLILVGSGPLEADIRGLSTRLNVDLTFAGFKNQGELPACYGAADVLVLTSVSETWGLVVNEAMACGLPAIVSTACGCEPDLIVEGETGFAFTAGEVAAFTAALARFVDAFQGGFDFGYRLERKMSHYSMERCAEGTLAAVQALCVSRED
jgi:glycosyltransferase involved in cell wall biosynthesis